MQFIRDLLTPNIDLSISIDQSRARTKAECAMSYLLGYDVKKMTLYRQLVNSEIGFTFKTERGYLNLARKGDKYQLALFIDDPPEELCDSKYSYKITREFDTMDEACRFISNIKSIS